MLHLRYDPYYGNRYQYLPVPSYKYYFDFNTYDPLNLYEPTRYRFWYPNYWPSHLLEFNPTRCSVRKIRVSNILLIFSVVKRIKAIGQCSKRGPKSFLNSFLTLRERNEYTGCRTKGDYLLHL